MTSTFRDHGLVIELRILPADCLSIIAEIDRSEHVDSIVKVRSGQLTRSSVDLDIPRWSATGTGPNTVNRLIDDLKPILDRGASLVAAYDRDAVAGVAIVEECFEGDLAWLVFLHVSREYRGRGVGSALWFEAVNRSTANGARSIYVSAIPTGATVDFYLARGCKLVTAPHPELYRQEPEDIHLQATLA